MNDDRAVVEVNWARVAKAEAYMLFFDVAWSEPAAVSDRIARTSGPPGSYCWSPPTPADNLPSHLPPFEQGKRRPGCYTVVAPSLAQSLHALSDLPIPMMDGRVVVLFQRHTLRFLPTHSVRCLISWETASLRPFFNTHRKYWQSSSPTPRRARGLRGSSPPPYSLLRRLYAWCLMLPRLARGFFTA